MLQVKEIAQLCPIRHDQLAASVMRELAGTIVPEKRGLAVTLLSRKVDGAKLFEACDYISTSALGFLALQLCDEKTRMPIVKYCLVDSDLRHTEDRKGIGIGRMLIQRAITVCREYELPELQLNAVPDAIPFYTKLGFARVDDVTLRMRKTIQ